ncbi:unnamed protein product [Didymodactylos carnosus]|nr:unnamed protein product [Didymodactylos carnosus]CAF4519208.1 unnamed protein product [Didymodactylos carnosus]
MNPQHIITGLLDTKVITYPSQQVVATYSAVIKPTTYLGSISILNPETNQWVDGQIKVNSQLSGSGFDIYWDNNVLTMQTKPELRTSNFFDTNGKLLAKFKIRADSIDSERIYYLHIYSNKYPEPLYLLELAARDHHTSTSQ